MEWFMASGLFRTITRFALFFEARHPLAVFHEDV